MENYRYDIHSQNGEDGILNEILKRLNIEDGYVCEFGAWDGVHLSNTYALVERGFKAIYIEGDPEKYKQLVNTRGNIIPINKMVDDLNQLDDILDTTDIPEDFDVLSIDIDSYDYQVWRDTKRYKPKIVIIEINSGISPDIDNHIHDPPKYQGTSFKPMLELGLLKGYKFVTHTGNMIFVREDLYEKLRLPDLKEYFCTRFLE